MLSNASSHNSSHRTIRPHPKIHVIQPSPLHSMLSHCTCTYIYPISPAFSPIEYLVPLSACHLTQSIPTKAHDTPLYVSLDYKCFSFHHCTSHLTADNTIMSHVHQKVKLIHVQCVVPLSLPANSGHILPSWWSFEDLVRMTHFWCHEGWYYIHS